MNDPLTIAGHTYDRFHVVQNVDATAGFSALMTYALNGTREALAHNWLPVINFDRSHTGLFYDPARGENVWEYYFEPVLGVSYVQLDTWLRQGQVATDRVHSYSAREILDRHLSGPNRLATFWTDDRVDDPSAWMSDMRRRGRELVARFIRLKPHIEARYRELLATHVRPGRSFGVHIRGTDFSYADPTPPERYFRAIRDKAGELGLDDFHVFLATDQQQFVERFEREFPGRISTCDASRSRNDVAPFQMDSVDPYKKGEDVLLDILLLSSCDFLFKSVSAVGEYAMWFNPRLECHDFALESRFRTANPLHWTGAYLKLDVDHRGRLRVALMSVYRLAMNHLHAAWNKCLRLCGRRRP